MSLIGSLVSSIVGGGVSAAGGLAETFSQDWLNRRMLKQQFDYSERYAKNHPSWAVAGLRAANLNPILAATDGSFSSPTVPSVGGASAGKFDFAGGIDTLTKMGGLELQEQQVDMQKQQTDSNVELQRSQGFKNFVDGLTKLKQGGYSGNLGALHELGTSLGMKKDETEAILKAYGFDGLNKSHPSGSETSSEESKLRNHPNDNVGSQGGVDAIADSIDRGWNDVKRLYHKPWNEQFHSYRNAVNRWASENKEFYEKARKSFGNHDSSYHMPQVPRSKARGRLRKK